MAFYQGNALRTALIDTLINRLTTPPAGSLTAYWTAVQSGTFANEGYVLSSNGKSGTDKIFVRIKAGLAADNIVISFMENYVPNLVSGLTGTATNESPQSRIFYTNQAGYTDTFPVYYWLSFDKDKIMLALWGDRTYVGWVKTFTYIGMPDRLGTEPDSTGAVMAMSRFAQECCGYTSMQNLTGNQRKIKILRDRVRSPQTVYELISANNFRSRGWGGHLLLPEIFVVNSVEGTRARLEGMYSLVQNPHGNQYDFRDGDEVTIGSRRFTIMNAGTATLAYHMNCFPTDWIAVEQLS